MVQTRRPARILVQEGRSGSSLRRLGLALLTLSFLSISWNAVRIKGLEPGQILLGLAAGVLALDAFRTRESPFHVPVGMVIGAGLILLAGLLTAILPPSPGYIAARFVVPNPEVLYGNAVVGGDNLTQLGKFEIALIVVILTVLLLKPTIAEARRLAGCWAVSALISAAVAVSDASGHTSISTQLLGFVDTSGRQAGLSEQANHLAVAMAIVVPIVLYWLVHGRGWLKVAAVFSLGLVGYGALLAGSRGGFVGVLLAGALFILMTPRLRVKVAVIGIPLLLLGACVMALAFPAVLSTIATDVRLAGDSDSSASSDVLRSLAAQQALLDVQQSPVWGIGFDHLNEATEVHLQMLAAGGVLALVGYIVYWITVLRKALVARFVDTPLTTALVASVLTFLLLNFVENQVADTYLYVPAALLVALATMRSRDLVDESPAQPKAPPVRRPVAPAFR
jgi:hypothetical protein